jgi:hypothetical protein
MSNRTAAGDLSNSHWKYYSSFTELSYFFQGNPLMGSYHKQSELHIYQKKISQTTVITDDNLLSLNHFQKFTLNNISSL